MQVREPIEHVPNPVVVPKRTRAEYVEAKREQFRRWREQMK